jgi:5'-nucleotidase
VSSGTSKTETATQQPGVDSEGAHVHLLLTNDDGYLEEGLLRLRAELIALGAHVTVIAPDENRSGVARAITLRGGVSVRRVDGTDEDPVYACSGTPVDCVRVGTLSELIPIPDAVVSGINHGLNLGDDHAYSGTVGAAVEAVLLGYPGMALSQETLDGSFTFDDSGLPIAFPLAALAARLTVAVAASPPPTRAAVNINLPAQAGDPAVVLTRPGRRFYARGLLNMDRSSPVSIFHPYGAPGDPPPPYEKAPGTDFAAIETGLVAVSLIAVDWSHDGDAAAIEAWHASLPY